MSRALSALRKLRASQEREAVRRTVQAEQRLEEARQARDAAEWRPQPPWEPISAETARALRASDVAAWEQLRELHQQVDNAAAEHEAAYLQWSEQARARKQIERLEERQRAVRVATATAARQKALDAAAVMRWGVRR